ncbi:MAG: hypothetical protein ACR2NL_02910 [Acidimicrobiia bacterium]
MGRDDMWLVDDIISREEDTLLLFRRTPAAPLPEEPPRRHAQTEESACFRDSDRRHAQILFQS